MTAHLTSVVQNSLGVECLATNVQVIESAAQAQALVHNSDTAGVIVIAGGSNVVLANRIELPVWLVRNRGISARVRGDKVEVDIAAGENWHDLVRWTLAQGFYGLENLALIPGSVGAAPVQNIGAYGVELADVFVRLKALDLRSGRVVSLSAEECEFSYRHSMFKGNAHRFVIVDVTLRLSTSDSSSATVKTDYPDIGTELQRMGIVLPAPIQVAEAVIRVRRRKLPDPRSVPNAGSFFKNPVISSTRADSQQRSFAGLKRFAQAYGIKLSAAELIDRCGFKERRGEGISVWPRQPLVLINPQRADGAAVLAFAGQIQDRVEEQFGIRLEVEPDVIGF